MMFCSGCGSRLLTAAKFCHSCGLTTGVKDDDSLCVAELEMDSSERKRHQSTPLTFDEYREKKERNEARGLLVVSLGRKRKRKTTRVKSSYILAL